MNIVILDANTLTLNNDIDFSVFEEFGNLTVYQSTEDDEVAERIKDADVVLCNKSIMNREKMQNATRLKYIGLFATGYNNIDLEYTNEHGITVCNAGSYSTDAVAQHVFALILHNYNKVAEYDSFVKNGGWIKSDKFSPFMEMQELLGVTIGIIGYGSIGKKVAEIARAFGMNVMANSRSLMSEERRTNSEELREKSKERGVEIVGIDELLKRSDIVTMHCPLNKDSEKMCNKEFFSKMKPNAMFINTSRGGVVDEAALVEALNDRRIALAALDVISKEPMEEESILLFAKNIVLTPHAAWGPLATRQRLVKIVSKNLKKWLAGTPINVIK